MNSLQFYNDLKDVIGQKKIKNLKIKLENDLVVINASYFNFNTINHLVGLLVGVFLMTINSATFTIGILLNIVFAFNLFQDGSAINKILIDFNGKKIFLYSLLYFGKIEIQFIEFSKFTTSDSGQFDLYNRTRLKCNLKTGEKITLFDFSDSNYSPDFINLFNCLLKLK